MVTDDRARQAAALIEAAWRSGEALEALPGATRPRDDAEGYAAQAALEEAVGDAVVGWKIAATSTAGQAHIGVNAPIAGRIFARRRHSSPAEVSMAGNRMAVAEAEFAFMFRSALPPRDTPYELAEVMAAVGSLHPAIELPSSRFTEFASVGAPSLAADNACAHELVLGPQAGVRWREMDLAEHPVRVHVNGALSVEGNGGDVLGDPRAALTWLVNSPALRNRGIHVGEFVTTGVCGRPADIVPGDRVEVDFGALGTAWVSLRA